MTMRTSKMDNDSYLKRDEDGEEPSLVSDDHTVAEAGRQRFSNSIFNWNWSHVLTSRRYDQL